MARATGRRPMASISSTAFPSGPLPAQEAFVRILRAVGRPGGAVLLSGCGDSADVPLFAPSASLASALDLLTAVHSAYRWTIQDGVFLLLPKGKHPPVLDVPIGRFQWDTSASVHLTVSNLADSAPVRYCLSGMGFHGGIEAISRPQQAPRIVNGRAEAPPQGHQFHVENVKLLDALNAVASSYGSVVWCYEERACDGSKTYSFSAR